MKPKHKRLIGLLVAGLVMTSGLALMLSAFSENLIFFYTPSQLSALDADKRIRIMRSGGLVEMGSVQKTGKTSIRFVITDLTESITADYTGLLPSLFREGQGVVAQGTLQPDGSFHAATILAKHDENYMPPEVVEALKASGRWEHYGK